MTTYWTPPQRDLFEPAPPVSQLSEVDRRNALDMLQALLAEAMNHSQEKVTTNSTEADDDENIV
jgi:hypothetical protein